MTALVERFDRVFPPDSRVDAPNRLYATLTRLPDRILQILVSVFVAAYLMAELSLYKPYTVLPLAVIFVVLTWRLVPTDVVASRRHALAAAVAVLAALAWVVVQLPFETEFLIASRDPGIYSNLAASLAHTGSSTIDVSHAVQQIRGIPNATANLGPFQYQTTLSVQLQGGNALPSMLGLGYWVGGINGLTVVNSVLGGFALVGVFSLARRILGARWGLFAALILGLSMPMVYFARAPYTEVLSLAVFIAAVTWLWSAFETGRRREFVMAGILAGAACMTRIDALLGVAALIGFARPRGDFDLRRSYLAYVVPLVVLGIAGAYDQLHNFPAYVIALGSQSRALWALCIATILLGFVVIGVRTLVARRSRSAAGAAVTGGLGRPLSDRTARVVAIVVAVLVPLTFLFWAVRPKFLAFHFNPQPSIQNFTRSLQGNLGLPLDGSRSYDEYSLYWFVWYFGAPFVLFVVVGLAGLFYTALTKRRPGVLVFFVLTMGVALLYLNKISIAPDQMWAFRRVLPIVAPGFLIAAVAVFRWLASRPHRVAVGVAGAGAALLLAGTVGAWTPRLFITTEYSNQATELRSICAKIGDSGTVVLAGRGPDSYALSLKTFCDVDVVSVYTDASVSDDQQTAADKRDAAQKSLASIQERIGGRIPVLVFDESYVNWQGTPPPYLNSTIIDVWQRSLLSAPNTFNVATRTSWMGTLTADGLVKGD